MYILAGWEGSAHDGRVLKDARSKGFPTLPGKYFLGDAGYANDVDILAPYRGVRYHLREISAAGLEASSPEELFNYRHSSLRNAVERVFGVFKRRWRLFKTQHEFSVQTQVKLVYGLAGVHNFINKVAGTQDIEDVWRRGEDDEEEEYDEVEVVEEPASGSRVAPKDEGVEEILLSSQQMGSFRDDMAERMWKDYNEWKAFMARERA